jgi:hypothetical protein
MNTTSPQESKNTYPGDLARPEDIQLLADEYKKAAQGLLPLGKKGKPLTRAPYRLVAIHAIELYLNAYLLRCGYDTSKIRALKHDLGARAQLATEKGLSLRKLTLQHIISLTDKREYLVARYGPEMSSTTSQINRLSATLDEVSQKSQSLAPTI